MSSPEDALGKVVAGKYRLDKVLGEGGFGAVYVATAADGTQVALKVLAEEALERVGGDDRFRREAELARRLDHPNVVRVLDEGIDEGGTRFIAFELLRGRSLSEELERWGAVEPRRAAGIALQVLDALEVAHGIGIIHRDLKPANIFLMDGPGDSLKVLDFGIAKSINKNTIAGLTQAGQVLGTPAYMAVEQLTGDPVTPATDLFALGVMLIEMLLGKPPYPVGSTAMDIVRSRLTGLHLDLPMDLAQSPLGEIARRATMPHPLERFQTVADMRAPLQQLLQSPSFTLTRSSYGPVPTGPTVPGAPEETPAAPPSPGAGFTAGSPAMSNTPGSGFTAGFTAGAAVYPAPGGYPAAPVAAAPYVTATSTRSSAGLIVGVAAAIGVVLVVGVGVGLWVSASAEDRRSSARDDRGGDDDDDDDDDAPVRKKQNKRKEAPRDETPRVDEPMPVPLPPLPVAPPPPPPPGAVTRVLDCAGAALESSSSLTAHAKALGWTVTGQLQLCTGDMVNFVCRGPGGKGITFRSGTDEGSATAVKFPSASAATQHADEQRGKPADPGTTWARDGASLLYIDMRDAEADRLLSRICR